MSLRQIRRVRRTGWSLLVVAVLFAEPAPAMHPHIAFDELAQTADAIFVGEVVDQHSYWEAQGRAIFTDVTFQNLIPVHQGSHCAQDLNETVTLTFAGGQVGDIVMSVSDSVTFAVGQKVVLFALMDGKVYANPLVGGRQGLFRVEQDPKTGREAVLTAGRSPVVGVRQGRLEIGPSAADVERRAVRTAPDPQVIGSDPRAAVRGRIEKPARPAVPLEAFIDGIQDALAGPPPARPALGFLRDRTPNVDPPQRGRRSDNPDAAADPIPQAMPRLEPGPVPSNAPSGSGQELYTCGYFNLPITMKQVPTWHPTYLWNSDGLEIWNRYMRLYPYYRDHDGWIGWNWENEIAGFLTESQMQNAYGSGWGTAIAMCMTWALPCKCCVIQEADIAFRAGLDWRYDINETLGHSDRYLYFPALMHELGHTWGLQRSKGEDYNYDHPSVMHGYYSNIVEDGLDIHVADAILVRQQYKNQTSVKHVQNMGVESYYASGGLHNATTDATVYQAGDDMTISGITVENLSTVDAEKVRVRAYLSIAPNRMGEDYQLGGGGYWHVFSREHGWTGDLYVVIPQDVLAGFYFVTLKVTANDDEWPPWDGFSGNRKTSLYEQIEITCPSIASPTGLTASKGTFSGSVALNWNAVAGAGTYEVWRNTVNDSSTATMLIGIITSTAWWDHPPVPGEDYWYWVRAVRACGTVSGFSVPSLGYRGLELPVVTGTQGEDHHVIMVTWPAVEGATHYQVWRSNTYDLSGAEPFTGFIPGLLSYTDAAPVHGRQYFYWVKPAVSYTGHNAPDLILERVGIGSLAYPPPTNVSATKNDPTHPAYVKITWDMNLDTWYSPPAEIQYWIYRGDTNDPTASTLVTQGITELEYNDYTIADGPLCYYWVRACYRWGTIWFLTPYSEPDTGSRPPVAQLNPPPNVNASVDTSTEHITITWGEVYGATHYRVWEGLFGATPVTGWITGTTYNYAAPAGCDYYFFVTAGADAQGTQESPFGGGTDFHGPNRGRRAIAPPGSVRASDGTFTHKIRISWKEVETCWDTHYKVYRHWHDDPAAATEISDWQLETEYDDTVDPIPGRNYWYWVRAASIGGSYPSGFSAAARGYRKLSRPQNVAATNGGSLSIVRISWASVGGASHYRVYRHTHNRVANATPITDWIGGTTTYDDDSAEVGQAYWYWVRAATSSAGVRESDLSESDRGYVRIPSPTGLTASQGTHADSVALGWNPVSSATHYRVYRSQTDNSKTAEPVSKWRDSTNYHDVSAAPAETYYYWVNAATDSDGDMESGFSQSVSGHRLLPAPLNVQASSGIYTRFVSVAWSPVQEATHYRVYRSDTPAPAGAQPITPWREHLSSYNDATPTPGRVYHYFVKAATDESGTIESPLSEGDGGYIGLTSPTNVSATDGMYENRVFITWDEVPHATHYCVYRHTERIPIEGTVISGWQTAASFSDETADADTLYYYWVKASPSSDGRRPSRFSLHDTGWCGSEIQAGPDLLLLSQSRGARGRHD